MQLRHCDICGALVAAPDAGPGGGPEGDVGLLCDGCVRSRRVLPDLAPAEKSRASRFRCPHCDRRLRTRPVRARIELSCPKCSGGLILLPGNRIEAGPPAWRAAVPEPPPTPVAVTTPLRSSSGDPGPEPLPAEELDLEAFREPEGPTDLVPQATESDAALSPSPETEVLSPVKVPDSDADPSGLAAAMSAHLSPPSSEDVIAAGAFDALGASDSGERLAAPPAG